MDVTVYSYSSGDPVLIDKIVNEFLSQGKFDKLRKECMADADTKPAYQNLQLRVENIVAQFLKKQIWKPDLNKNHLRDSLRKHILESGFLDAGINRIVDQIVNPNVLATVFMPEVEEVVCSYLSIPRPDDKSQKQCDFTNRNTSNNSGKQSSPVYSQVSSESDVKSKMNKTEENHANGLPEKMRAEDTSDKASLKISDGASTADYSKCISDQNAEILAENAEKDMGGNAKHEVEDMVTNQDSGLFIKEEFKPEMVLEDANDKFVSEKMELPSDDSQESLSRMGVERLRISESDGVNALDSDASFPMEINEKSMSDSRDSDDSIMNKMSPISQGRLTPEDSSIVGEEKEEKEETKEKNPLTFIGRIPKIKRDDSESYKSSKKDDSTRMYLKCSYSSDESDSSKHSLSKSDSDDKKSKEKSESSSKSGEKFVKDKKYKEDEKRRKSDHHKSGDYRSHSKDEKSRHDKSRSRRDDKDKSHSRTRDKTRDKSRDKTGDKKGSSSSSSSHSRSKSSSHHRSVHNSGSQDKEHHRDDSRSRDKDRSRHDRKDKDKRYVDKKKKEEEKRKKSKKVDDHGKERNKRDDRRSTDRDSNERERDRTKEISSSRVQSDSKKKESNGKVDDTRKEKTQREENDRNEVEESAVPAEDFDLEKVEDIELECVTNENVHQEMNIVNSGEPSVAMELETEEYALDVTALCSKGALTKVQFPKIIDDFYVKFNSTGFRYFEDWETTKMDCEDEFKEYIDEAEKDLSLLSDDGSDYESYQDHIQSESLKIGIISNSIRGLGNFAKSLIFDPNTYDFYKWTSHHWYRRQVGSWEDYSAKQNREESIWVPGLTEDDEIQCMSEKNKENQERDRKIRKSLKLLNRYHRKMGLKFKRGKEQHKFVRRRMKHEAIKVRSIWNNRSEEQIKWRVLNASENVESHEGALTKGLDEQSAGTVQNGENFVGELEEVTAADRDSTVTDTTAVTPKMDIEAKIRLYQIQSLRRTKSESGTQKTTILARVSREEDEEGNMVDSEVVNSSSGDYITRKIKKRGLRVGLTRPKSKPDELDGKTLQKKMNQNFNLPLSPESDDSTFSNTGVIMQKKDPTKSQRKRVVDSVSSPVSTDLQTKKLKDQRRSVNQKYDSQDLYKPRPFSIGSKTRGRALRVEGEVTLT